MQFDALVSCYFLYMLNLGAFNIAEGKHTLAKKNSILLMILLIYFFILLCFFCDLGFQAIALGSLASVIHSSVKFCISSPGYH